jgi:hypothetical protein
MISNLADQLAIVVLYRVVETIRRRIFDHKFGVNSKIEELRPKLLEQGIDINPIPHHRAVDELRLLNNAVKHEGRVSPA